MKRAFVLAIAFSTLALSPPTASAQFAVYDAANYQRQMMNWLQAHQQVLTAMKDLETAAQTYQLMQMMSKNIPNMRARYATAWAPWRYATAPDLYGNDVQWVNGANTGIVPSVLAGYQRAINTLQPYTPSQLAAMPTIERQRVESDAATVELRDGASEDALETIGAIRANAAATTTTIGNIQSDSLSNDPSLNAEVSVLNKVNATNVLALQNGQDTNKLLVAIVEQNTIRAKELRDAQTDAFIQDLNRRANTVPMNNQLEGSIESAIANFKLP